MPRVCTICSSASRAQVDRALVSSGASNRRIAAQHALAETSVRRHRAAHLPRVLALAAAAAETSRAVSLVEHRQMELERLDAALLQVFPGVNRGDLFAVDRLIKLVQERAKLLGLYANTSRRC
jgi:hypothetical protein